VGARDFRLNEESIDSYLCERESENFYLNCHSAAKVYCSIISVRPPVVRLATVARLIHDSSEWNDAFRSSIFRFNEFSAEQRDESLAVARRRILASDNRYADVIINLISVGLYAMIIRPFTNSYCKESYRQLCTNRY
jgi:hypothetical protein